MKITERGLMIAGALALAAGFIIYKKQLGDEKKVDALKNAEGVPTTPGGVKEVGPGPAQIGPVPPANIMVPVGYDDSQRVFAAQVSPTGITYRPVAGDISTENMAFVL